MNDLNIINTFYQKLTNYKHVKIESFQNIDKNKIKKLNISNDGSYTLPKSISECVNMTELLLYCCKVYSIPSLFNCSKLHTLKITECLNIKHCIIDNLNNLIHFEIYMSNINYLPNSLGNLSNLEYLRISHTKLKELPKSIGNCQKLKSLDCWKGELCELPDELCNCTNLTELSLSDNKLIKLPNNIGNLTNLLRLGIADNKIRSLPESIGLCTKINNLYLGNNNITSLPSTITNLTGINKYSGKSYDSNKIILTQQQKDWINFDPLKINYQILSKLEKQYLENENDILIIKQLINEYKKFNKKEHVVELSLKLISLNNYDHTNDNQLIKKLLDNKETFEIGKKLFNDKLLANFDAKIAFENKHLLNQRSLKKLNNIMDSINKFPIDVKKMKKENCCVCYEICVPAILNCPCKYFICLDCYQLSSKCPICGN